MELQRTDDWYLARKGKFTASEILDICESEQKFETACYNKAYEAMMPDIVYLNMKYNERSSDAMRWGVEYEPEARRLYEERIGKEVTEVGFISYDEHSGGSPDGIILDDNGQIEIKCPFNGTIHMKFFEMRSQKELLEYCKYQAQGKKYYFQMQFNMLINKSDYCDFLSFDPRLINLLKLKQLLIEPDKEVQQLIIDSLGKAVIRKQQIIEQMMNIALEQKKIRV